MDFPIASIPFPPSGHIHMTHSLNGLGSHLISVGGTDEGTNAAWPAANRALYMPFYIPIAVVIKQGYYIIGVPSGNADIGLYDMGGTRLVSSGSVAVSGANTIQVVDFTDTLLNPGYYYYGMAVDTVSATFYRALAANAQVLRAMGMQKQDSAFPLPSSASFANVTDNYVPRSGITLASVI